MNTFTTHSNRSRRVGFRLIAVVAGVCALSIPASAAASYGFAPESASGAAGDDISRNAGLVAPDHTALNDSLAPATGANGGGAIDLPASTPVSSAPASADSFDWADAALGAGVVMAVATLGGLALVTLRRRTAVSPSAG